jgi:hypothetical protein
MRYLRALAYCSDDHSRRDIGHRCALVERPGLVGKQPSDSQRAYPPRHKLPNETDGGRWLNIIGGSQRPYRQTELISGISNLPSSLSRSASRTQNTIIPGSCAGLAWTLHQSRGGSQAVQRYARIAGTARLRRRCPLEAPAVRTSAPPNAARAPFNAASVRGAARRDSRRRAPSSMRSPD